MTFDHALKLDRAALHLKTLEEDVVRWFDGSHHRIRVERDGQRHDYASLFVTGEQPSRDTFSLLIGEILHNLRSSLDNLAFELASAYTNPLPDGWALDSGFPIFPDDDRKGVPGSGPRLWMSGSTRKIRGMDPLARAEIEGLQPYQRGAPYRQHPLWRLHDLNRLDKHRLLNPVSIAGVGLMADVRPDRVNVIARVVEVGGVIQSERVVVSEREARFARLPWPSGVSKEEMEMQLFPAFKVVFEDRMSEDEPDSAGTEMASIYQFIQIEVLPRLGRFLL